MSPWMFLTNEETGERLNVWTLQIDQDCVDRRTSHLSRLELKPQVATSGETNSYNTHTTLGTSYPGDPS